MSFYVSHFEKKLPRLPRGKPLSVIGYVHDDVSGDREIDNLVDKNEKDKKIIDLFRAQLLLPIGKRSKALMSRFGIDVSKNGQIDAWPTTTAVKFHVNCYMPIDTAVQDASRLAGTKSKVLGLFNEASTGNTYFYYFPVSMHGVEENNILKLDRFNTYIYRDTGEPVPDRGDEYNLYHALYDHLNGRNIATSRAKLTELGMYSEAAGVTFTLRNHGILVDSSVRNPGNSALNLIEQQSTSTPAAKVSEDELNQELPPIGEDTLNPKDTISDNIEEFYGLNDNDITDYYEGPNLMFVEDATIPKQTEDMDNITDPPEDVEQEPESLDDFVNTEIVPQTDGKFLLDDIVKSSLYKNKMPFNQLFGKYKGQGYKVQINQSSSSGYKTLQYPQFVIQNIDTNEDKKLIKIVFHDTAHHKHIKKDGHLDMESVFDIYNSEFVSAGNAVDALKNMEKEHDVKLLKMRMNPFTLYPYKDFRF